METQPPQAFIFMRVGSHAGESFDEILERKQRELADAGRIFWGYGGPTLHPITQVQPFAKLWLQSEGSIQILMQRLTPTPTLTSFLQMSFRSMESSGSHCPKGLSLQDLVTQLCLMRSNRDSWAWT